MTPVRLGSGYGGDVVWRKSQLIVTMYGDMDATVHVQTFYSTGAPAGQVLQLPAANESSTPHGYEDEHAELWIGYRTEQNGKGIGILWTDQAQEVKRWPVYGLNPIAFGCEAVVYQEQGTKELWLADLEALDTLEAAGAGSSIGVSHIEPASAGRLAIIFMTSAMHGYVVGDWAVVHLGNLAGARLSHADEPNKSLVVFPGQDANEPRIAVSPDGNSVAVICHGQRNNAGVRFQIVHRSELVLEGEPPPMTFENKYNDLVAVSEDSANWEDARNPALTEGQRLDACMAFVNECAFIWNEADQVAAGAPGSYGKLWRASKNSYSDDCIAIIGSDGKLYESDCIKNGGAVDAVLQWMTPSASKWAYHAPTDPGDTSISEPGPEPEPPPTGDDMHFAINEDLTSRALDELDALNKKHWKVDRAPNPSISRYIFGIYEPNMQTELNKIGHLPGDPAIWEQMHDDSVYKFTQQLYTDHHGATVPGEPIPAPDPQ